MVHLKFVVKACLRPLGSIFTFPEKLYVNTAIIIVLISFLFMCSGCKYYKVVTNITPKSENLFRDLLNELYPEKAFPRELYPEGNLVLMMFQQRIIYAIDSTGKWRLENPLLINDTLICKSRLLQKPAEDSSSVEQRKGFRYYPSTEAYIIKKTNLYVKMLNVNDTGMAYIPLAAIEKYDIYKKHSGKNSVVPIMITIFGTFVLIMIIGAISVFSDMEGGGTTVTC